MTAKAAATVRPRPPKKASPEPAPSPPPTPPPRARLAAVWTHLGRLRVAIWVAVALILIAIILNFLHRPAVEFSLSARAEAFSFRSPAAVDIASLTARQVQLQAAETLTLDGAPVTVRASGGVALSDGAGDVTLAGLSIPAGWRVSLEGSDAGHLLISASPPAGATGAGKVILTLISGKATKLVYAGASDGQNLERAVPEDTKIEIAATDLALEVGTASARLLRRADVTDLSLARDSKTTDAAGRQTAVIDGSIVTGKLWREYAPEATSELGPIDLLLAGNIENGVLRDVRWGDNCLSIYAHGNAGTLTDQIGTRRRDLRPVWLDALQDMGFLKVVLGIVTFIGGLELSAFIRRRT